MTPAGIELATFRFVAQHLNHCATAVPQVQVVGCREYGGEHSGFIKLGEISWLAEELLASQEWLFSMDVEI